MYVQHPYVYDGKYYAKIDGAFYEISKEVAMAMLSEYRKEIYRSRKWAPESGEEEIEVLTELSHDDGKSTETDQREPRPGKWKRKTKRTEILGVTKGALSQRVTNILKKMRTMYLNEGNF